MLEITQECLDEFRRDAEEQLPNEACGILAGNGQEINKYIPMTNIDESPEHFSFDMKEAFTAIKQMRKDGLEYLAVIHSHPETPARPSIEDIRLAFDPTKYYLILSLIENGGCKAWKISKADESGFKKVEFIEMKVK